MRYKLVSDWCILSNEKDKPMLHHALTTTTTECNWHDGFVEHLMENYFNNLRCRTVIDIGASYGWMAVSFAKYFKEVKCFEIRDDVSHALLRNVEKFPNVRVFRQGLSNKKEEVSISNTEETGRTRIELSGVGDATVNLLDSFNFETVDCIKIDVEGHELEVLQGAIKTIKKWKPLLIVEIFHSRHRNSFIHRQQIFNLLKSFGYEIADVRHNDFTFTI